MTISATKLKKQNSNGEELYFIEEIEIVKNRLGEDIEKKTHQYLSKEKLQAEKADIEVRVTQINALLAKMI
jgi:DNA-binding protein